MDMYQKRKMRQEKKKNEDNNENQNKINLSWYPGHMAKTKKQIQEDLKLIDVVVEVLDARIPKSSSNPDIQEWIKNKKKVIALNKSDLASEEENNKWINYFKRKGIPAVLTDSNSGKGINEIIREIEKVNNDDKEAYANKGRVGKSIRVMIVGIPNVGKSSFINRISKKTTMTVGNKPGVTRQKQWIRVNEKIELLDTPGVLWPKFENEQIALDLSFTGTIKDDILEKTEIAYYLLKFLLEQEKENLVSRYKLDMQEVVSILSNTDNMENENILEIMHMIGRKRGAIISGGNVDEEKVATILLDEFRSGKLGRITIEKC